MNQLLQAILFPFLHTFKFGDGEAAAQTPATETIAAPESTDTPTDEPANEEAVAAKTFTEEELKAQLDAEAAKIRNKYERKLEKARIEAETRAKVMQEITAKSEPASDKPKAEDYADYAEFIEDLTDWKTEQKLSGLKEREANEKAKQSQLSEQERTNERQRELIETGEGKYDDFEEVVKSDKTTLSRAGYLAILESDIAADIVYHLAKNQEEAKRIENLPAYAQAKEIGKLEDKLSAQPKKSISKAPAPITPVSTGKASNDSALTDDLPIEEWMARRNKQARGR